MLFADDKGPALSGPCVADKSATEGAEQQQPDLKETILSTYNRYYVLVVLGRVQTNAIIKGC